MKKLLVLGTIVLFLVSCAGTQITTQQEDALLSLAGNALAVAYVKEFPADMGIALDFCDRFAKAQDLAASQALFEAALTYLGGRYDPRGLMREPVSNALQLIGISNLSVEYILAQKVDTMVKVDGWSNEMWHKAQIVVGGFCRYAAVLKGVR